MTDLSVFIKDNFTKNSLLENSVYIENLEDIHPIASKINIGECIDITFKNSILKNHFFDVLSTLRPDSIIINCNCSINTFNDIDIENHNGLVIFNNIKKCKYAEVLESIKNYKGKSIKIS